MEAGAPFIQSMIEFIGTVSTKAADLDGRVAFFLGLVTWFVVEQIIRRLAGLLRCAILIGALAAAGSSLKYFLELL